MADLQLLYGTRADNTLLSLLSSGALDLGTHKLTLTSDVTLPTASGVTGSGTAGRIPQWSSPSTIGDSTLAKTGTGVVTIDSSGAYILTVAGTASVIGTNTGDQDLSGLALKSTTIGVSGLGLSGGGDLSSNRTITLASSSSPGAAASILASNASGDLTLQHLNLAATANQIVLQSAGITGTLTWTPTTSGKTITFPDATGTVALTSSLSSYVPTSRTISVSGLGLSGGGDLTADRTITLASSSSPGAAASILATNASGDITLQHLNLAATSNQIVMQSAGITGTLTWTPTSSGKTITFPDATGTVALTSDLSGYVPTSRTISVSGLGLSGGGDLSTDRTITLTSSSNPGAAAAILASTAGGDLTLQHLNLAATSNQIVMQSAGVTGTLTWTPVTSGKTITFPNATGTVALTSQLTPPGGADTQIQFNDGGSAFGGDSFFTWDKTTHFLTITSVTGALSLSGTVVEATTTPLSLKGPGIVVQPPTIAGTGKNSVVLGGDSSSGDGGYVRITGGQGFAGIGTGGMVLLQGGNGLNQGRVQIGDAADSSHAAQFDVGGLSTGRLFSFPDVAGTFALGSATLTVATSNSVTVANHTHAITTSAAPGAAASILATDSSGNLTIAGTLKASGTTDASSTITGSLQSAGGLGVAKSIYGGASLYLNSNAAALPASLLTGTTSVQIDVADSANNRVLIDAFAAIPILDFRRANGTSASKSALAANDLIGVIAASGYGASAYGSTATAQIRFAANQTWTGANQGTFIQIYTTPNNSTAALLATTIGADQSLVVAGTTDASSVSTGALQSAGGLGVAKKAYFGDKVDSPVAVSGYLPMVNYGSFSSSLSANGIVCGAAVGYAATVKRFAADVNVAATNNGTNYWTIRLINTHTGAIITSFNTSADTAGTWTYHESTGLSTAVSATSVYVDIVKTNSPGAISFVGASVYVE